jgi:cytoskeleton protein RodZ
MKRVYSQDIENAASSLDTQCFRIYYHIPKVISWDPQRFRIVPNTNKEDKIRPMTQVSHLYAPPQEPELEERNEAPVEPQETESSNLVDISTMKPGARLRQAREQKKLSVQQIADRLYLDAGVIDTIESDDYDRLPSPIFVRGYLRSYAKLLDLPAESIVEAYELIGQQSPPPLTFQLKQNDQANSDNPWVKAATVVIAASLVILVSMWAFSPERIQSPPTAPDLSEYTHEPVPLPTPPTDSSPVATDPLTAPEVPVESTPAIDNVLTNEGTAVDETNPATVITEAPTEEIPAAIPSIEGQATAIIETTPATVSEETAAPAPSTPENLRVLLQKDTWMRIKDNEGKSLFDGIGKAGREIELTGTPPFKMKVGHTEGITLEYQDKKSNFANYPGREGRELTIGTSASVTESSE